MAKSGRPGESAKIRIRGTNTLTGDAEPLWVIDGVPLQRNIPSIEKGRIKAGDFNDTATTEIYTLSLHDALPIWRGLHKNHPDRSLR